MNLSKSVTMSIIEHLIEDYKYFEQLGNFEQCLKIEAEIKCFQHHLKKFVS